MIAYISNPAAGFINYFEIVGIEKTASDFGTLDITELIKVSGGSDTYITTAAELTSVLGYTLDNDYSCMMVAEASGATSLLSTALDHIVNDAKGIKTIIAAKSDIVDAKLLAIESNSDSLIVTANQGTNKK